MELIVEETPDGVTRAALTGRLDIEGAGAIDGALHAAAQGATRLVIDLSGVTYVASMGLRSLMLCARTLRAKGGAVALAGPTANVEKVLRASGVDEVMAIFDSVGSAADALKG